MEKTNLHYSDKNIPTAPNNKYKIQLISKIEAVIRRMRWKAMFFERNTEYENVNNKEDEFPETYGLKTTNTPPPIEEMANFEKDLIGLVQKIKFKRYTNDFQKRMQRDIKTINNGSKLFVPADKTSNMYKVDKEAYEKILTDSITKTYKKAPTNTKYLVDSAGKKIIKGHSIVDRIDINGRNNCFITLKDHKGNFENNPTTRLINPAKNELGRISKVILEKINSQLRTTLHLNQWKSTSNVTEWFSNIKEKQKHKFMMFDVKDF